mmetsp:Transcript_3825/g.4408  ORF Transcript_3825/g.4408 Transcript_3825/m.4408 type:complete len:232 (-) Transcript_3825:1267-1962(-)
MASPLVIHDLVLLSLVQSIYGHDREVFIRRGTNCMHKCHRLHHPFPLRLTHLSPKRILAIIQRFIKRTPRHPGPTTTHCFHIPLHRFSRVPIFAIVDQNVVPLPSKIYHPVRVDHVIDPNDISNHGPRGRGLGPIVQPRVPIPTPIGELRCIQRVSHGVFESRRHRGHAFQEELLLLPKLQRREDGLIQITGPGGSAHNGMDVHPLLGGNVGVLGVAPQPAATVGDRLHIR